MNKTDRSMLHRALCITLSALLVVTVAGIPESFAASLDAIGDAEVPMASFDDVAGDEGSFRDVGAGEACFDDGDTLIDAEEAALAEEERSTDVDELGYIPGEIIVVYEESASDAEKQAAIDVIEGEESGAEATFEESVAVPVEISDDVTVETAAEMVKQDPRSNMPCRIIRCPPAMSRRQSRKGLLLSKLTTARRDSGTSIT